MFYIRGIFGIAIFGLLSAGEPELLVTTCKRDLVDYNICLKHALQEAWPRFVKGLPEFDFPPLDPLVYKNGKIEINSNELRIVQNFSNLIVIGLSQARFSDVRTYFFDDVFRFEMDGQVPILFIEAYIKVNGTINIFKVIDEGHANLTLKDAKTTCNLTGHVVNDTWIVEHFRISPSFGDFKIYATSIFEENKAFIDIVLSFINEYWPLISRLALPFVSDTFDQWFTDHVNIFFSKVRFSNVFP